MFPGVDERDVDPGSLDQRSNWCTSIWTQFVEERREKNRKRSPPINHAQTEGTCRWAQFEPISEKNHRFKWAEERKAVRVHRHIVRADPLQYSGPRCSNGTNWVRFCRSLDFETMNFHFRWQQNPRRSLTDLERPAKIGDWVDDDEKKLLNQPAPRQAEKIFLIIRSSNFWQLIFFSCRHAIGHKTRNVFSKRIFVCLTGWRSFTQSRCNSDYILFVY